MATKVRYQLMHIFQLGRFDNPFAYLAVSSCQLGLILRLERCYEESHQHLVVLHLI